MGTTIYFDILKRGNKRWWDARVKALNHRYRKTIEEHTEPMRTLSDYDQGWPFVKTYAEEPYHSSILRMLKESGKHGYELKVHDEKTGKTTIVKAHKRSNSIVRSHMRRR